MTSCTFRSPVNTVGNIFRPCCSVVFVSKSIHMMVTGVKGQLSRLSVGSLQQRHISEIMKRFIVNLCCQVALTREKWTSSKRTVVLSSWKQNYVRQKWNKTQVFSGSRHLSSCLSCFCNTLLLLINLFNRVSELNACVVWLSPWDFQDWMRHNNIQNIKIAIVLNWEDKRFAQNSRNGKNYALHLFLFGLTPRVRSWIKTFIRLIEDTVLKYTNTVVI